MRIFQYKHNNFIASEISFNTQEVMVMSPLLVGAGSYADGRALLLLALCDKNTSGHVRLDSDSDNGGAEICISTTVENMGDQTHDSSFSSVLGDGPTRAMRLYDMRFGLKALGELEKFVLSLQFSVEAKGDSLEQGSSLNHTLHEIGLEAEPMLQYPAADLEIEGSITMAGTLEPGQMKDLLGECQQDMEIQVYNSNSDQFESFFPEYKTSTLYITDVRTSISKDSHSSYTSEQVIVRFCAVLTR